MSKKYDLETLVYETEAFLKKNLNAQLRAIDSEKNDSITLEPISEKAYAIISMDDQVMNFDPFVFIDVNAIDAEPLGPVTLKTFTILVLIISEQANNPDKTKRLLRYQRALQELVQTNWKSISGGIAFKIQEIPVQDIILINSSNFHKMSGVQIQGSIA